MPRIVMLGSAFDVRGGVSAMARVCAQHGLFERWDALYLETHCDGSRTDKARKAAAAWLRFMKMLLAGDVALLHVHLNSDASFWRKAAFIVPALSLGVPYVLQIHCGGFADFYRERCSPRAQRLVRRVLRGARSVVALSEGSRQALTFIDPGLAVAVVPNPVAIPGWSASLDEGPPTALFLGIVKDAKGAFDLVRAWPAVREAIPEARLVMAGAGELERARELAREGGFEDALETPGWVLGADKEALLRRAWVFVLPSHWEAMPMAILEAMAAGLPVVATRVGGIPYTVGDGVTGTLVEPRNLNALSQALVGVLGDAARRRAMGAAGRARASDEFSAEKVIPAIESLWRAIVPRAERGEAPPDGLRPAA
ncbi:MAG TPA: glycosyltransferase family 4 protein [Usitatibacter sp.]|nr:glycosyltransferase family 4 protein [Usitatibacter sp.]